MTEDKKDKGENLKQFIQKYSIGKGEVTKAPPPITPLSGWGYVPPKTSDPKPLEPQEELFVSITGTELMQKWSVGWEAIFHFAEQENLIPYKPEPEELRRRVNDDFDYLTSVLSAEEREEYFSKWRYHPNEVEAFEAQHGNILDEWRKKVTPSKSEKKEDYEAENFLTRKRDFWDIGFQGKKGQGIKHLVGLQYIAFLLKKPEESVSCTELYHAVSEKSDGLAIDEGLDTRSSKQGISDFKAQQDYLSKWKELQNDIENAEDTPEGEMVKKESKKAQDKIKPYLKKRNFADPNDKKAQVNVRKCLNTAYAAIRKEGMKEMEKHLRDYIKSDSAYGLRYSGPVTWEITIK